MPNQPGFNMRLERVQMPVSDIDRAKTFYVELLGFNCDFDHTFEEGGRLVQLTPPGSACSIALAAGIDDLAMPVGSQRGFHLVVDDIRSLRTALLERGVQVGEVIDLKGFLHVFFADPDGNTWVLQEIPPGR